MFMLDLGLRHVRSRMEIWCAMLQDIENCATSEKKRVVRDGKKAVSWAHPDRSQHSRIIPKCDPPAYIQLHYLYEAFEQTVFFFITNKFKL